MKYPKRPQLFANRFVRLMMKDVAAQEIGPEGFALLTAIVMTEDAKRYRGPVVFFNQPLMGVCGFASEKVFFRVRQRCVDAGWLVWIPGKKGVPARYWVAIPDQSEGIQDGPVDEFAAKEADETGSITEQSGTNREVIGNQLGTNRESIGGTFIPIPKPLSLTPNPKEKPPAADVAPKRSSYSPEFDEAWAAFKPSYRGGTEKPESFAEWKKAVRLIGGREGVDEPHLWLLSRIRVYAASPLGTSKYSPAFCRWLKQGRYDDDDVKWQRAGDDQPRAGPGGRPSVAEHNADVFDRVFGRKPNVNEPTGKTAPSVLRIEEHPA